MLSKFKKAIEPRLMFLVHLIPESVGPNALTLVGLLLAAAYLLAVWYRTSPYLILFLYAVSVVVDAVDGLVARASGRVSKLGAFLDSTCDRLVDAIHAYSLYLLGVCAEWEAYVFMVVAYTVSYARARAEGLGLSMSGVGLMERGERVIGVFLTVTLALFLGAPYARPVFLALLVLTLITVAQRIAYAARNLGRSE